MLPSHQDLTYFIEIATTLNFSRAAERLGITQPSLSLSMQKLEKNLGTDLLIRHKNGVNLTQAGKQLLRHAHTLLESWDKVRKSTLASMETVQGSYVLGCHQSVALFSLPYFLPELFKKYPELEIRLKHDLSRRITEAVIRMEIDLGIVVNPVQHPDLVIRRLCLDEVGFWSENPSQAIKDLQNGKALLLCDPELLQIQSLLKKLKSLGLSWQRIIPSSSLEVIASLAQAETGIAILPSRVASGFRGLKPLKGTPTFEDEICLLYRNENKSVEAIRVIAEAIKAAFSKETREESSAPAFIN